MPILKPRPPRGRIPDRPLSMEEVAELSRQRLAMLAGRNGQVATGLRDLYRQALEELRERTKRMRGGGDGEQPFSRVQAHGIQAQLEDGIGRLTDLLEGYTLAAVHGAASAGVEDLIREVKGLESHYLGVAVPLSIEQAAQFHGLVEGAERSILRQHASSIRAYGEELIGDWEGYLGRAILAKTPFDEVVDRVAKAAARPGLRSGDNQGAPTMQRWKGDRIVRTEVLGAYNGAKWRGLQATRDQDLPDLKKIAKAVFDDRTAPDSYPVHNQVRALDEEFEDGAGRRYLYPPGRPNDREVVLPWRDAWADQVELDEAPELPGEDDGEPAQPFEVGRI